MQIDIVKLASIISAAAVILGVIIGGYKLYDKILDNLKDIEKRVDKLEHETVRIKEEDRIIISSLRACLDGLHQQGCNGEVTKAMKEIDDYINNAAHD